MRATAMVKAKKATSKGKKASRSTINSGPQLNIPDGESHEVEPEFLLLDPQNLRLLERVDGGIQNLRVKLIGQKSVQDKLYKMLLDDKAFDVKSLETSIAHNSFLRHERLIVARYDGEKFLVLEGNRRLTAVRHLLEVYGPALTGLPDSIRQSLKTLPCFVLNGSSVGGSERRLNEYRRASEIYVGMRHLMGAKKWEPASRYEFEARLIEEGWSVAEIAERFGSDKSDVMRDLKAQRLYRDFGQFERKNKLGHSLTYNAFAEAARAPSVMNWLGWSNEKKTVVEKDREASFFHYLISRLKARARAASEEGEEESAEESAETIVRRLRDMLKLRDENIESALVDRDFDSADLFFEEKRKGALAKRIASYTRGLKRITSDELADNPKENKAKLTELIEQAKKTIVFIDALLKR
jgi:hypothetical protein